MPAFSRISALRLATAHPLLQQLFNAVILKTDCSILCGFRTEQAQQEAFETGTSKLQWPRSKHNAVPSLATDVAPFPINWNDLQRFRDFAVVVKDTADQLLIDIEWGGDWAMRDMPHWQLKLPWPVP